MNCIARFLPLTLLCLMASAQRMRIIGGRETGVNRYPYAVALTKGGEKFFCGGSLIALDVVLTAAHCMGGSYYVAVGRHDLTSSNTTGDEIPILKEIIHPDWNQYTDEYDFALVILERPTKLTLSTITLNPSDSSLPFVGTYARTMGWGDVTQDDDTKTVSDVLMAVDVEVISNTECSSTKGTDGAYTTNYKDWIFSSMICAFTPGSDACQGDSGGPLIVPGSYASEDVQIGIVSWGIGCARMFPGVYSRVSVAYDWIKEIVCEMSSVPPEALCRLPEPTVQPSRILSTSPSTQTLSNSRESPAFYTTVFSSDAPIATPSFSPSISSGPSESPTENPSISSSPSLSSSMYQPIVSIDSLLTQEPTPLDVTISKKNNLVSLNGQLDEENTGPTAYSNSCVKDRQFVFVFVALSCVYFAWLQFI